MKHHLLTITALICSALGFFSQMAIAMHYGTGVGAAAFFYSLSAPMFVGGLVASAVNISLTPRLREEHLVQPDESAFASIQTAALRLSGALTTLGLCSIPLQWATLPSDSPLRSSAELLPLMALSWCFAGCLVLQSVASASLLAEGRSVIATLLPGAAPLITIATIALGSSLLGIYAVSLGQVLGAALAAGVPRLLSGRQQPSGRAPRSMRSLLAGIGYGSMAVACFAFYPLADALLAPHIGVHVVAQMAYAQRIIIGLGSLSIAGAFAGLANRFADMVAQGQTAEIRRTLIHALTRSLIPSAALALCFMLQGPWIVGLMFGRGKFSAEDVAVVGQTVAIMAPGMLLMLMTTLLYRAGFALPQGARNLAPIGLLWIASYLLLGWILPIPGPARLAAAYSTTWLITSAAAFAVVLQSISAHTEPR